MSFDLQKILESKRAMRRNLAARPVAEKLRMLDALRERALAIGIHRHAATDALHEKSPDYRTQQPGKREK